MPTIDQNISSRRATRWQIAAFLDHKRIAAIGLSRNPADFTRNLVREFRKQGYEVIPVNPAADELEGAPCFARVQDIEPAVAAALLLTAPSATESVVRDCVAAGITHIWMYGTSGAGGAGAVSQSAVDFCREHGVNVVMGECPFMFLPKPGFPHRVHGLIRKIVGSYPR
jgi:predicted CoA-binding protein